MKRIAISDKGFKRIAQILEETGALTVDSVSDELASLVDDISELPEDMQEEARQFMLQLIQEAQELE